MGWKFGPKMLKRVKETQSQVDLSSYAGSGDVIRIQFDFGFNDCHGHNGWYIDDVSILMVEPVRSGGGRAG